MADNEKERKKAYVTKKERERKRKRERDFGLFSPGIEISLLFEIKRR